VTFDIEFTQGDIVVVPFPYTDRQTEKRRPALVISSKKLRDEHGLVWLVMITSAENQSWYGDVTINSESSGLSSPSVVRTAKLATIDAGRIIRVAGKLNPETFDRVQAEINRNLR
jgi:mRNA interferase MazF